MKGEKMNERKKERKRKRKKERKKEKKKERIEPERVRNENREMDGDQDCDLTPAVK